jgi:hypothetical protein
MSKVATICSMWLLEETFSGGFFQPANRSPGAPFPIILTIYYTRVTRLEKNIIALCSNANLQCLCS